MQANPIQNIDDEEDLPDNSDMDDPDELPDEWWEQGKKRKECNICFGIGCNWCNNLGYTLVKH